MFFFIQKSKNFLQKQSVMKMDLKSQTLEFKNNLNIFWPDSKSHVDRENLQFSSLHDVIEEVLHLVNSWVSMSGLVISSIYNNKEDIIKRLPKMEENAV